MDYREYLVTASEMKQADADTIERIGIPSMVLMERAAIAVREEIDARFGHGKGRSLLILCGSGNNGGDGLALARLLVQHGWRVDVCCAGRGGEGSQWQAQMSILENYPVSLGSKIENREYTILIDALFGVGLSREITGKHAEYIRAFNERSGYKIAVDIPSGIHSDSGRVMGTAVRADLTVTFAFAKRGLMLYPGAGYAGEVRVKDIGISLESFRGQRPGMFRYTGRASDLLPKRRADGNKGTFGKVLLIAGSRNMAGAAVLGGRSAYCCGAGMVKLVSPECNREIIQISLPEALYCPSESSGTKESEWMECMEWADVLAVGPGLGTGEESAALLEGCISGSSLPLVIDADGLNLLAGNPSLQEALAKEGKGGRTIILTPHMGELARLTGKAVPWLKEHQTECVQELAERFHCVVVGKDARTVVCGEEKAAFICTAGNSGMAVAGSGDVLTGILAGLLAQGMSGYDGACAGVYLHACAGDASAKRLGENALMASDIIDGIGEVLTNGCQRKGISENIRPD